MLSLISVFMKLLLALIVVALIAGSLFSDYKWRSWMAARKRENDHSNSRSER